MKHHIEIDTIYIQRPYDRGFPHNLRTATATAVISEEVANWLEACGMQIGYEGVPDGPPKGVAWARMSIGDTYVTFDGSDRVKVSKKVAGLLRTASESESR